MVCVCVLAHLHARCICGKQLCRSQSSPFKFMWVLGDQTQVVRFIWQVTLATEPSRHPTLMVTWRTSVFWLVCPFATAHLNPSSEGSLVHWAEVLGCIWMCSGAKTLWFLLLSRTLPLIANCPLPQCLVRAALLLSAQALCVFHSQTTLVTDYIGYQMLSYGTDLLWRH